MGAWSVDAGLTSHSVMTEFINVLRRPAGLSHERVTMIILIITIILKTGNRLGRSNEPFTLDVPYYKLINTKSSFAIHLWSPHVNSELILRLALPSGSPQHTHAPQATVRTVTVHHLERGSDGQREAGRMHSRHHVESKFGEERDASLQPCIHSC